MKSGKQRQLGNLILGSCPSVKSLEFPFSLSDTFYSNLWQLLPEIPPTLSSLWFANILFIKVNEVLECDYQSVIPPFPFFLSGIQQKVVFSELGQKRSRCYLCSSQVLGAGQERGQGQRTGAGRGGKGRRHRMYVPSKLCLVYISPGVDYVFRYEEASLFLHFLIHTSKLITDLQGKSCQIPETRLHSY